MIYNSQNNFQVQSKKSPHNLFINNCVFTFTCLNLSPSKYSPFDAIHLSRHFFYCSEQFLILMPFSASAIFCFTSSTSAKCFSLRNFFIRVNKNGHSGIDWVNREGVSWGSYHLWPKTAQHSAQCGQVRS